MASRDKSQNVGFVYTNIYQLYKKSQSAPQANAAAATAPAVTSDSNVWRADSVTASLAKDPLEGIKITKFQPRDFSQQARAAAPATATAAAAPLVVGNPFDDLKQNILKLQDLHSKLRFMLKELEDLVQKK